MGELYNQKRFTLRRRILRRNAPYPEQVLWRHLKGKQTGQRFRRQFGIGPYVVDFYCPKLKLVIEIDGDSHFTPEAIAYDQEREAYIVGGGARIIRFTNIEVTNHLDGVLETIREAIGCDSMNAPAPTDLP